MSKSLQRQEVTIKWNISLDKNFHSAETCIIYAETCISPG